MTIEWFRDLVIVIYGLGGTILMLALLIMGIMLFVRIKSILDSAKDVSRTVQDISHTVKDDIAQPLAQAATVAQGIKQVAGLFGGFGRKREEK